MDLDPYDEGGRRPGNAIWVCTAPLRKFRPFHREWKKHTSAALSQVLQRAVTWSVLDHCAFEYDDTVFVPTWYGRVIHCPSRAYARYHIVRARYAVGDFDIPDRLVTGECRFGTRNRVWRYLSGHRLPSDRDCIGFVAACLRHGGAVVPDTIITVRGLNAWLASRYPTIAASTPDRSRRRPAN